MGRPVEEVSDECVKVIMRKLLLLFCLIYLNISAQNRFELFPNDLNFQTLKANYLEPRVGVWYHVDTRNLKVDLGNTVDLFAYHLQNDNIKIAAGIDFFGYALTTSYAGNRLQIDALDGFFGGNLSLSKKYDKDELYLRFRIIHNSAHLVDGHYDKSNGGWIDHEPIPYTRDFGEITAAYQINKISFGLKYYGSIAYATLIRPNKLEKYFFTTGFELFLKNKFGAIDEQPITPFIAYHFHLEGIPEYTGNNNFMAGVKFGRWNKTGVLLYLSYYSGKNVFSEYYYQSVSKFGLGFSVEFI